MNTKIKQAVMLAGGMGTRLKPFTDTAPKPMFPFKGIPFIDKLIRQLKSFGIEEVVLLLGYLPEKITEFLGDGSQYGLKIIYDITPVENDTGARLSNAKSLFDENFLFLYCDNYCPVNYPKLLQTHFENNAELTLTAYANRDGYTKSNLKINESLVEVYDKKRITEGLQGVDIGYAVVNKKVLELLPDTNCNFEKEVYPQLVEQKKLFACVTEHRYYSVGSYERIALTEEFFKEKKVVFLDRDGTLNEKAPQAAYIEKPEDFKWLPKALEAIKLLYDNDFKVFIITNQPGIARGNLTTEMFEKINEKMLSDIHNIGADIAGIYYCPHNWDENCFCRKPKPGMFYNAQREHSLDLTKCYMVGDDERDIVAGQLAGCKCKLLDLRFYNLYDAAWEIIKEI
ncbi:MAG: HAD-IIIA family hydrolase [Oscillospiraceae bacterium]|nr:HAD-IIIA family hydrolase [Oscillospiraceae bacterium]